MKFQRDHHSSAWGAKTPQKPSEFSSRPFAVQAQSASVRPPTQEEIENQAFEEQKFEATELKIKEKYGAIAPEERERLGVLQAKMDGLLVQRMQQASRLGHNFANIAVYSPDTSALAPIQPKLAIGQPGDKYEQEADAIAHQVVQKIHEPMTSQSMDASQSHSEFVQRMRTNAVQHSSLIEGQELINHELTPKVQQSSQAIANSPSNLIQRANTIVDDASDPQNTIAPGTGRGLLQDSAGTVQPSVQFGPLRNECATYMRSVIHPTDDMGGTAPQPGTWPSWWTANKPTSGSYWVRGHLLNHNIGGPGDDQRNLTPITKKANHDHLKLVETAAKKASAAGWGLDYTVEPKYDNVGPTNLKGDNTDPKAAVWPFLTTGLSCTVGFIHMKSGKAFYAEPEFIENKR